MFMTNAAALTVTKGNAHGEGAEKAKQWYAAYTCPRHEKRVWAALEGHEVESFLPTYKAVHRWRNGVKSELDLALFPGYVFVRIALRDRLRVLKVPGLVNLVGFGGAPAALPDSDVEALRSGLLFGYAAMIDGMVERFKRELGEADINVVATGGISTLLKGLTKNITHFDTDLTLKGIARLYDAIRAS